MKINTLITTIRNTVMKQLSVKTDDAVVLSLINLGLVELYKRFPLKTEEHIIRVYEDQSFYEMPDDFMWIVSAYGEVPAGSSDFKPNELEVNNEESANSINTVSWNTVQVPSGLGYDYISIIYATAPVEVTLTDLDTTVKVPPQLIEALIFYIGYMGTMTLAQTNTESDSVLYKRFENSCTRVLHEGMITRDGLSMEGRINKRGFV